MSTTYNVDIVGNLTNNNGVLSGFSSSNYASFVRPTFNNTFEVGAKITTGNNVSDLQIVYCPSVDQHGIRFEVTEGKFGLLCGANGAWINTSSYTGGTVSPNTTYYLKASYNGTTYKLETSPDSSNYTTVVSYDSSTKVTNGFVDYLIGTFLDHNLGIFQGSIDLNYCYIKIDDTLVWEGVTHSINPIPKIGSNDISKIYLGNEEISKIYLGSELVYEVSTDVEQFWTQPILNSNGTVGGNTPAIRAGSEYDSNYSAYMAVDASDTSFWASEYTSDWLEFYSPDIIKPTQIIIQNRNDSYCNTWASGTVYGSIDGIDYFILTTFTNTYNNPGSTWIIQVPQSNYCKYVKIDGTGFDGNSNTISVVNMVIEAKIAGQVTNNDTDSDND